MGGISIRWLRENDENNNSLVRLNYLPNNGDRNNVELMVSVKIQQMTWAALIIAQAFCRDWSKHVTRQCTWKIWQRIAKNIPLYANTTNLGSDGTIYYLGKETGLRTINVN
jgi:hypothetical protein